MRAVFVEYAWDMGWCDPCAADPLSNKELVELGARWIGDDGDTPFRGRMAQGANAYVTRLHVRYDATVVPGGPGASSRPRTARNFQGRYVLRHPWQRQGDLRRGANISRPRCRRASSARREPRRAHRLEAERDRGRMEASGQP